MLVIDEADEMLNKGFKEQIYDIYRYLPPSTQVVLISATMPQEVLDHIVNQVPVGRMANPEEIAFTVAWLADDRNAYMTGANIPVNGGMFMSA